MLCAMLTSTLGRRAAAAVALSAALLLSVAACSPDDDSSSSQGATTLDAAAFGERAATDGVVVLDVRTPEEFASGHLVGAVNINLESGSFESDIAGLDQGAPYAVYCRSGNRSGQAMGIMQDAGFTDVAHLDGGIVAWQEAGGQIVTD